MKTINAHDLKSRMENSQDTLVIDVLPTEHYESGHIPGATNVPLSAEQFVNAVDGIATSKEQPVVVYCANTECDLSPKAAERLESAGFKNVADFEGGMEEWKAAGMDVARA
jgi:rhodanese-related sulfurtransferase